MASTEEEYREILTSEVFIELDKLRDIARHGVPDHLRGDVWCYLLGVRQPDKSTVPVGDPAPPRPARGGASDLPPVHRPCAIVRAVLSQGNERGPRSRP